MKQGDVVVPLAIFEFKYMNTASDRLFFKDVDKVLTLAYEEKLCKFYPGFIQEAEYTEMSENYSWLTEYQNTLGSGKLIEMTGGLYKPNEQPQWIVREVL
ncbi:hypothetical protein [Paenibacillus wynnii]|uniref:hypothetical protein n=1 Tax=Paenibacillus wynnii TaxID=268407 RepID=UPI00278E136A|nr:hypothetical protein [Paenibacillus wynnii]MDQ0192670.1 hypothetical protein [Paenibacillus wynnii]